MAECDDTVVRILDANLNRAREALRVSEEYARFELEDAALSAEIKEIRHGLARSVPDSIGPRLALCRDIKGDVGTKFTTESELQRSGLDDVLQAATHRATEALRALEEFAKPLDTAWAQRIQRIRYQFYDWSSSVERLRRAIFQCPGPYVLITESRCRLGWLETAEAALNGGATCLQLREKQLSDKELIRRAKRLSELCRSRNAIFIVNDRPDVARIAGADGVHLGQTDMGVADARRLLGCERIVGVSTHNLDEVKEALAARPDYIAVGPMFASPTKPEVPVAGPSLLATTAELSAIPLVAIGGITTANLHQVLASAACTLCVCASVVSGPNVEAKVRELAGAAGARAGASELPGPP